MHLYYKFIVYRHGVTLVFKSTKQTKQKNIMLKKYANKTGGGPRNDIVINNVDDQIISLINLTTISGHQNVSESTVKFDIIENISIYLFYFNSTILFY